MPRPKKGQEHPKKEIAQQVEVLVAAGTTHRAICSLVNVSSATLHKHYSEALEIGAEKANGVIGGVVYQAARKGEPWACQLIAKTRMGWSETSRLEMTGKDGGPIQTEAKSWRELAAGGDKPQG